MGYLTSYDYKFAAMREHRRDPSDDISWLLVAIDRNGDGWILDAAEGFFETDLLVKGASADDNGVEIPPDLITGVYRVMDIRIMTGYPLQFSGSWQRLWPSSGSIRGV